MITWFILLFAFIGIFILNSLFALLIATRNWHWFVKAMIIIISVLPLALVEATDLLLILLVGQLVILGLVCYESFRQSVLSSRDEGGQNKVLVRPKFSLVDLMLGFVVAGCIMAIMSQLAINRQFLVVQHLLGIGFAAGVWSMVAVGIFYWKIGWRKKLPIIAVGALASFAWSALDDQWLANGISQIDKFGAWAIYLSAISFVVLLAVFLYRFGLGIGKNPNKSPSGLRRTLGFCAIGLLGVTSAMLAGSVMFCFGKLFFPPPEPRNVFAVNPGDLAAFKNALECGKSMGSSQILMSAAPLNPGDEMQTEIQGFAADFAQLENAISHDSLPWIDWSDEGWRQNNIGQVAAIQPEINIVDMRSAARALQVRARQTLHDGNADASLEDGLRIVKLSQSPRVDGILLTWMDGNASERMGHLVIQAAIAQASKEKLAEAARRLDEHESHAPTIDQIVANEDSYIWQRGTWRERLYIPVLREQMMGQMTDVLDEQLENRNVTQLLLRTSIAIELYNRENGRYPADLSQLIPGEVPIDPFSPNREPLKYENLGDQYRLYSVGLNRTDDAGFVDPKWDRNKGDLDFAKMAQMLEDQVRAQVAERENLDGL